MLEVLVDVALRGKNETSRVNAAVAVWNRAWGAPKQSVDVEHTHKQDWSALLNALDAHNAAKALTTPDQPLVIEGQLIEEKSE